MKLDPNDCCVVWKQHIGWAIIHDLIAHPIMALTLYKLPCILTFHNYTSHKAWVRKSRNADDINK